MGNWPVAALAAAAILGIGGAAWAGEPKELSDEELKQLEEALGKDAEAADPSDAPAEAPPPIRGGTPSANAMNPEMALILDTALAWFSDDDPLQAGAHDPNRTGFNLQQLEMHLAANVDPYFRLEANLVFTQFGVEAEEAYASTLGLPGGLQVRLGQFLTRFGRLNATHPHSWHFVDQPLVNGKFFGGEGSRGLGGEISWLTPLPWYAELLVSVTMADGECCARSFLGGDAPPVESPADLLYTLGLQQFFPLSDDWSLMWGVSGQLGPNSTGYGNRTAIYGTDLYLRWRPLNDPDRMALSLQLEAMVRAREVPRDNLLDWGGYAHLVWNIDPRWEVGVRYDYVHAVDGDPLDPDQHGERHRLQLQGTYYPSHFTRIRLQGTWDAPEWREAPIWAGILGFEFLIGAHGAHAY